MHRSLRDTFRARVHVSCLNLRRSDSLEDVIAKKDADKSGPPKELVSLIEALRSHRAMLEVVFRHVPEEQALTGPLMCLLLGTNQAIPFLTDCIKEEVTSTLQGETLFRTNSMTTFLMSRMAREVGRQYLRSVVQPLVEEIASIPASPDVKRAEQDEKEWTERCRSLSAIGDIVLERIIAHMADVPTEIREICAVLKEAAEAKFDQPDVAHFCVAGFFFLRFFCPALLSPQSSHLIDQGVLTPTETRRLLVVGKIVQSLANGNEFTTESMSAFNELFIARNIPKMNHILDALVTVSGEDTSSFTDSSLPQPDLQSRAFEDLCDVLREVDANKVEKELAQSIGADPAAASVSFLQRFQKPFKSKVKRKLHMSPPPCTMYLQYSPYGPLLWTLANTHWHAINAILGVAGEDLRYEIGVIVVKFLAQNGQLEAFIVAHLRKALAGGIEVMKGNSPIVFLLRCSLSLTCNMFINDVLSSLIEHLLNNGREMDLRISSDQSSEQKRKLVNSAQNFCEALTTFWTSLRSELHQLPPQARSVLGCVAHVCHQLYGDEGLEAVGFLFFHGVVCPRIASPQRFGMLPDMEISPEHQRRLLLTSKVFQNLAKMMDGLESSRDYVKPLSQFFVDALSSMRQFHRELLSFAASDSAALSASLDDCSRSTPVSLAEFRELFAFCGEQQAEILASVADAAVRAHFVSMLHEIDERTSSKEDERKTQIYVIVDSVTLAREEKGLNLYCEALWEDQVFAKTHVKSGSTRVAWVERFSIYESEVPDRITFEVSAREKLLSDTFIGRASVLLSSLTTHSLCTLELPLRKEGVEVGQLAVHIEIAPQGAHGYTMCEHDWHQLSLSTVLVEFIENDELLCTAEDRGNFFRVMEGSFDTFEGETWTGSYSPGDLIGGRTILLGSSPEYRIVATKTPSSTERFTLNQVLPLLDSKPELLRRFYHHVAVTLRRQLLLKDEVRRTAHIRVGPPVRRASLEGPPTVQKVKVKNSTKKSNLSEMVVVDEFPCKLGRKGILYVVHDSIFHFSRLMGMEKKVSIGFDEIGGVTCSEKSLAIKLRSGKKKHLTFTHAEHCLRVTTMIEKVTRNQEDEKSLGVEAEQSRFGRAIVLQDFAGTGDGQLPLIKGETVFVVDSKGEWWSGSYKGKVGTFPKRVVELLVDVDCNKSLLDSENVPHMLSATDWVRVFEAGTDRMFAPGDVILPYGHAIACIYQVISGVCRVELSNGIVVGHIRSEGCFGELSWLDGSTSSASVIADTPVHVFHLDGQRLKAVLANDPLLAGKLFKYFALTIERRTRAD